MKNFKLLGMDFECDEKYNYATRDEDGSFWVYIGNPKPFIHEWDSSNEMMQVFPIIYEGSDIDWKDSKIEI